jgi:hypothetical protein
MTLGDFLADHGTKILGSVTAMVGTAQVGLSSLVSAGELTAGQGVAWQFALGIAAAGLGGVTIARGFSTGAVVQQARQIVATNAAQFPPAAAPPPPPDK